MNPLHGVRVIELATVVAGPMTASILARLGAEVIKIERPGGDEARRIGGTKEDRSVLFDTYNRGKKSVVLDLSKETDRSDLDLLCETGDVFLHSMRGDAAAKLGLDAATMRTRHPKLIYCAISGFGSGPAGLARRGTDPVVQAFCGLMEMMGHPDSPPVRCPASVTDLATAQWGAISVLAALMERNAGGSARSIELSLVDSAMSLIAPQATAALMTGVRPPRCGSGHPLGAPHEVFDTADIPIFISASSPEHWRIFTSVIRRPELAGDPRFSGVSRRIANRSALRSVIEDALRENSADAWIYQLTKHGILASEVFGVEESVTHPLAAERRWFEDGGPFPVVRLPVLVDGKTLDAATGSPGLGEDTDEVLLR